MVSVLASRSDFTNPLWGANADLEEVLVGLASIGHRRTRFRAEVGDSDHLSKSLSSTLHTVRAVSRERITTTRRDSVLHLQRTPSRNAKAQP